MVLSFSVAILVFILIAPAGSAPIDKEIFAVPAALSYTAGSITLDNIFPSLFSTRLSDNVVNFEALNLMDSFTKETRFVPGSSQILKRTISPTFTVEEEGSKERLVDLAALLLIF